MLFAVELLHFVRNMQFCLILASCEKNTGWYKYRTIDCVQSASDDMMMSS